VAGGTIAAQHEVRNTVKGKEVNRKRAAGEAGTEAAPEGAAGSKQ